jgi:uncharacterized protein YkwD
MWKGSFVAAGVACAIAIVGTACAEAPPQRPAARQPDAFASRLLADHNGERMRRGATPLAWSAQLAHEAQGWADRLARDDRMYHSDRQTRRGAGENLWSGTAGYYGAEEMVGGFLAERKYYKPGTFPQVSTTGKWEDVGHYTQVIWPTTQQVGCAVARNRSHDFLVCRYWPAGNVFDRAIG